MGIASKFSEDGNSLLQLMDEQLAYSIIQVFQRCHSLNPLAQTRLDHIVTDIFLFYRRSARDHCHRNHVVRGQLDHF